MSENLGTGGPLGVFPVQSDHGDVHTFHVVRANGDSLTLVEFCRVFAAITGRTLSVEEAVQHAHRFAEEDR